MGRDAQENPIYPSLNEFRALFPSIVPEVEAVVQPADGRAYRNVRLINTKTGGFRDVRIEADNPTWLGRPEAIDAAIRRLYLDGVFKPFKVADPLEHARKTYFAAEMPVRRLLSEFGVCFPDMPAEYWRLKFGKASRKDFAEVEWLEMAATCRAALNSTEVLQELALNITASPAGEFAWHIGGVLPEPIVRRLLYKDAADAERVKLREWFLSRPFREVFNRRAEGVLGKSFGTIDLDRLDDAAWMDCVARLVVDDFAWATKPEYRSGVETHLRLVQAQRPPANEGHLIRFRCGHDRRVTLLAGYYAPIQARERAAKRLCPNCLQVHDPALYAKMDEARRAAQ